MSDRLSKEDFEKHLKENCGDYNSMVSIAILYKELYGERPKIGMSGQQAEFMMACLDAFELASNKREVFYGVELGKTKNTNTTI